MADFEEFFASVDDGDAFAVNERFHNLRGGSVQSGRPGRGYCRYKIETPPRKRDA